jgi:hypothetical protein
MNDGFKIIASNYCDESNHIHISWGNIHLLQNEVDLLQWFPMLMTPTNYGINAWVIPTLGPCVI